MHRPVMQATLVSLALIFAVSARAAQITVDNSDPKGRLPIISISGDISQGDDDRFGNIAAQYSNAIVVLDSDGGSLVPAMEIGKIIKLREYATVVYRTGTCASACALMWIAGARRAIFDGGRVGFHAA